MISDQQACENARSYYNAEGRLRATDRRRCVARPVDGAYRCVGWEAAPGRDPGAFEEYRYDALGRRVLVRTRFETGQCGVYLEQCTNRVVRTVWEGDQLLLELRSTGDERTLEYDSEWVAYTHGPGIDAPLAVRVNSERVGAARDIIPLANWRGLYDSGVFPNGSTLTSGLDLKQVEWAGRNYRAFFDYVRDETAREPVWLGRLMTHKRDASGQLYMRNRYFDPTSGRFTQEDPIGIAGGLNLYGFGGGDPVTYSDPYGLCPEHLRRPDGSCPGGWSVPEYNRLSNLFSGGLKPAASAPLLNMLAQGGVRNEPMVGVETRTQVHRYATDQASYIRIGPDFWSEGESAAAFMVAHEYGHVLQKEVLGLIYDSSTHMSLNAWNAIMSDQGEAGSAFFQRTQQDANQYACQATTDNSSSYHGTYCE